MGQEEQQAAVYERAGDGRRLGRPEVKKEEPEEPGGVVEEEDREVYLTGLGGLYHIP